MNGNTLTRFAAAALLVAAGACSTDSPTALNERMPDARTFNAVDPTGQEAYVLLCKLSYEAFNGTSPDLTTGRDFDFEVTGAGLVDSPVTLTAYDGGVAGSSPNPEFCEIVWAGNTGTTVTIEEVDDGYTVLESAVWEIADGSRPALTEVDAFTRSLVAAAGQNIVLFKNRTTEEPPEEEALGRMTGGGVKAVGIVPGGGEVPVTLGLTLHCDNTLSNNLEVNWPHKNQWHIKKESLFAIVCTKPDLPNPPVAPISRFEASAIGRLNGVWGSLVEFVFEDKGEPGRDDTIQMRIYPGLDNTAAPVLIVNYQTLPIGNFQMHYDQPHGQKPGS